MGTVSITPLDRLVWFVFLSQHLPSIVLYCYVSTAKVPQKYPANKELGIWVNKQRMERKAFIEGKKCSLTAKKIDKLEALGFEW